ncbi:MAG: FtsW/RodA/SpoVE family cell cycle protein, partial [Verrucomicrobiota bacterium]|nr:FtsW/RodA/SpoVE family cell cycle protein [Verrucomicrobiota bacterium]
MTPLLRKLLRMNWVLVATLLALAVFGVVAVYSATFNPELRYWQKQAAWVAIGLGLFIVTSLIDYRWVKWGALPLYLISIVFLILTYTPLGVEVGGARCWLNLKVITFQPSQLCVIAGVLVIALFLSQFRRLHPFFKLCIVGAIVGGPMVLILKQPDFGMTVVWVPVVMAMLFVGGIPKRYLIVVVLLGAGIALPLVVNFGLKGYQRARIVSFRDPDIDPK